MTILPKKKTSKEKNEGETTEHPLVHNPSSETRVSRSRASPPGWTSPTPREENLASIDPGGSFDTYQTFSQHEGTSTSHNKRRHRSSPHRNARKHRSHSHGHSSQSLAVPVVVPAETPAHSQDMEIEEPYNSEDEYDFRPLALPNPHGFKTIEELDAWFEQSLCKHKRLAVKKMGEDGACLFRAVADQVYGDQEMHPIVRKHCCDYMAKNKDYFSHYVTEDFQVYLNRKRSPYSHGNHVEIQAMSEMYNRPIEVYNYSLEPINIFHGTYKTDNDAIRISYHRNVHYNSLSDPYKATIGVGLGLPGYQPGLADRNLLQNAEKQSEDCHLEQQMLEDKLRETDWEVTQETIEEQVARESYLQWLRDNEKRAKRQASPRSASATCSTATTESQNWWDNVTSPPARSPETRPVRSPRNRTSTNNSAQNSPNRTETVSAKPLSPKPAELQLGMPGASVSPKPCHSRDESAGSSLRCPSPPGAVGGATGVSAVTFNETGSIMNQMPPVAFGLSEWDEDDIIAQVIAQSQQEYLDNLKKNAQGTREPNPGCSKDS